MGGLRQYDPHGNLESRVFDWGGGDDDRVRGEKILLYIGNVADGTWNEPELKAAVEERGFVMDIRYGPDGRCDLDAQTLARYTQLWYLSSSTLTLSDSQVELIADYVRKGNGLAVWADNDPYYADANLLVRKLIGTEFSGNKMADQIMTPADRVMPSHFIEHALTHGVNNLYEGATICTIRTAPGLTMLGQSHDGQMCMACFERDQQRIVLDCGFTKLYEDRFKRTAGTARYLRNIAFWLARGSRGIEYKLFTSGRGALATLTPGRLSERYRQTVAQPVALAYILTWDGEATLRLTAQDPRGVVVADRTSRASPLRVELAASAPGEWSAQVAIVQSSQADVAYALTLAVDHGSAQRVTATPPSVYQPVYLVIDGSRNVFGRSSALLAGVYHFVDRLRARASHGAGAQLGMFAASEHGKVVVAPVDVRLLDSFRLGAVGRCALGEALGLLLPNLSAVGKARPLVVILLASAPDDAWTAAADHVRQLATRGAVEVVAVGLGPYPNVAALQRLTPAHPLGMSDVTVETTRQLFDWLYARTDGAMTALESGRPAAPTPAAPACLRQLA